MIAVVLRVSHECILVEIADFGGEVERTLSIHTIFTTRREAFYWLAILFTFALGTAAGDLVAEKASLGYGVSIAIFGGVIVVIECEHLCMAMRGIQKGGSRTVTSAVRGLLRDDAKSRAEAMGLILRS